MVSAPKLHERVVLVPGSLALIFNLTVSGHANNYHLNNVVRTLVHRLYVKLIGRFCRTQTAKIS